MQKNNLKKNYFQLHLFVFIWGFTAILGALISLDSIPLVWYRMLLAALFIMPFYFKKIAAKVPRKLMIRLILAGIIIALHWIAFFTAILEPLFYKRKFIWYEIAFGIIVILGLSIIFRVETHYVWGIIYGLTAAFLSACFSLINGKLTHHLPPSVITFYELVSGTIFITFFLIIEGDFSSSFFKISLTDWGYLILLASICTSYVFIGSVKVMRHISPYTVMLTINLEPIYGILLAYAFFGKAEEMSPAFYIGAALIILTVIANGIIKNSLKRKTLLKWVK